MLLLSEYCENFDTSNLHIPITWQVAYRRQEGSHDGKVVIYLEGGGACWDTVTCGQRCDAGSEEAELCTADHDEVAGSSYHIHCICMTPGVAEAGRGLALGPGEPLG